LEEEVALDALPANVREGLEKKAGKGKLGKVESITKQGILVAYEGHVVNEWKEIRSTGRTYRSDAGP